MKNYIIVFLAVCLLASVSVTYKNSTQRDIDNFPGWHIPEEIKNRIENPFYLYLFFSERNCADCLEVIEVLNMLPEQFVIYGLVPDPELEYEAKLREITGASFEIRGASKFKQYLPHYWPTLVGVSQKNNILFVLPGVPNEKEYILEFLNSFYKSAYSLLLQI